MREPQLARIRRISQIVFLVFFLFLLFKTEFRGSLKAFQGDIRLPLPVQIFLQLDPLVAISNALATHALYRGLLWSLIILIPTLFLGRFFCGWICPLGTLNHFFGNLKSARKRGHALLNSNRYKPWQTLKYYILAALLVSALFGGSLLIVMDPIPLTVRSLGLSIFPGINYAFNAFFDVLGQAPNGIIQTFGGVLEFVSKEVLLSFKQPFFREGFFLGLLFTAILVLNLRITRFWCRALCPLGALLGLVSRWSILGLEKDPSNCGECNRCLLHCQGGDDPIPGARWRKSECHLCLNCMGECPEGGLHFRFFPGRTATVEVRGPAQKPRRAASPTVRVSSGPGIKAPESATMNEVTGTPANNHQSIKFPFLAFNHAILYPTIQARDKPW